MYVITLSTIPPRFPFVGHTLRALLRQTKRAERIVLYIPRRYRRFPGYDGALPEVPPGVDVRVVEEDIGPATKVLFAAEEFRGSGLRLLYCDDDRLYQRDWAAKLLRAGRRHPDAAIAGWGFDLGLIGMTPGSDQPRFEPLERRPRDLRYRINRLRDKIAAFPDKPSGPGQPRRIFRSSGFADIAEGFGGVLVRPEFFTPEDRVIPPVMWAVDDIWLSGLMAMRGIPIWLEAGAERTRTDPNHEPDALNSAVIEGADRHQANRLCAAHMRERFGIWNGGRVARDI
ncbi:glycosyltransferase family A protein [Frigidibacter mobilis]|uniref:Glycosyltransferase family 2 protein n=1 Tax=Frigidibacter mobilis TaxID=1335048 RepID=A0A159Z6A4_9RHOB|nr:glycosyltransferase family A protein [Frigidibacter mobilis]AMY70857.1 hypothetical protein AKL17_3633 [Frigidibacter mobilis]